MRQPQPLALFDFDDTLTRGDSIVPFLLYCRKRRLTTWRHILYACLFWLRQSFDHSRTLRAKEVTYAFLKGRSAKELEELARAFFREVETRRFLPKGLEEIASLRARGCRVLIVSASCDVYMRVLPEFLDVDAVLSTRCEVDAEGCYTGRIEANLRGEEKPRRLRRYLEEQGLADAPILYAYGDSAGDAPMLRLAERPILVDPKKGLRRLMPQAEAVRWH